GLRNDDVALLVEHPGNSAGLSHIAAVLAEYVTDFADCSVSIVAGDLDQDCNPARTIAFERELFVSCAGQLASTALDSPFDVVGGHVFRLGRLDSCTQPRIFVRIAA